MIRHAFAAVALLAAAPLAAQSTTQDQLDDRYDRALAAGYKALFLCSAIANAERIGATRTPESVMRWELSGIQAPLDEIVGELPYAIERSPDGPVSYVSVTFDNAGSVRYAVHDPNKGCSLRPISYSAAAAVAEEAAAAAKSGGDDDAGRKSFAVVIDSQGKSPVAHVSPLGAVFTDAFADSYGPGTRTTVVLVRRDGETWERYPAEWEGVPQRTWSVAKSIAATLVGAAVQRGDADVATSAGLGGGALPDPRDEITIDNLLRMASGRYSDTPGNRTDPLYFGGSTVAETALHWPLVNQPGTVYRYANNDTLAAVKAIGASLEDHPPAELFAQLGMRDTVAETDWRGDYILSSQVWSTARDLAKLGQLYLDDGVLPDGTRILPENWVDYVATPSGPQPDGPFGYGAGFWLLNKSDGVPADTFAAMGNRGQFIVIVPSLNVVIVRRGEDPTGSRFDIAAFTRDVLESLGK
ncbi:serine hydrolase domain-containing protein [Qipengyuania sp.]|uniref:serine hydrolase domain-containing protein n=1 Tax=Qipengyuania sp. TaxID=2004515 RepID=UPI003AF770A9